MALTSGAVASLLFVLAACGLTGCASRGHDQAASVAPRISPGYVVEQHYATGTQKETWELGADTVEVTLAQPSAEGRFPLVIYLPGLGESSDAGVKWRSAWSRAGYAVFALQPVAQGSALWSSALARQGEFRSIAAEAFSRHALARRLEILQHAFDELKRRQITPDPSRIGSAHIDFTRIAIAGYDLGAQTAIAVAGEKIDGVTPLPVFKEVKCVIALSPYADFSGAGFEQRFQTLAMPVLSITSTDDTDAYQWVTSAALRRVPFQYMPAGQKYLLMFFAAPHALMAGNEGVSANDHAPASEPTEAPKISPQSNRGHGGGHRGRRGEQASAPSASPTGSGDAGWSGALAALPIYVQGVSLAYLDASVKNDAQAHDWLMHNAQRWLGDVAEFTTK